MKLKAVSGVMLTLLVLSMLSLAFNIQPLIVMSTTVWDGVPDDSTPAQAVWVDPKVTEDVAVGETFVVDVLVNVTAPTSPGGTGMMGWEYKLFWDPSAMDVASYTLNVPPGMEGFLVADKWDVSGRHYHAYTNLFGTNFTGVTSLCTYTFEVLDVGSSDLNLQEVKIVDDTAKIFITDLTDPDTGTISDGVVWARAPPEMLCDLSVTSQDISFSEPVFPGSVLTITAVVHNIGEVNAENVDVQFFDNQNLIGEGVVSLSYHSESIVVMDLNVDEGLHQIGVLIDPGNAYVEIDEENNRATRSVLVGAWIQGGIILTGGVNPPVTNPGSQVIVSGIAVYYTSYGAGILVAGADVIVIVNGQEWLIHTISDGTYRVSIAAPYSPGNYEVVVMITDYTFWEKIELDLTVEPIVGLDVALAYHDLSFSSTSPAAGDNVTINATVHNVGTEDASNVLVGFYDNGLLIGSRVITSLPTGGSEVVTIVWKAPSWGWHMISVIADPLNTLVESNEFNNVATEEIYVYPSQPDLTLRHITLSDTTPVIDQNITVLVDVANIGGTHALNVILRFYDNGTIFGEHNSPFIPGKGGTEEVTFEIGFGSAGWHNLTVVVDPEDAIGEAVETNNHLSTMVFVHPPSADLAISSGDIIFSDRYPTEGDLITIYAQVHNIGELDAYDVVVEFVGIGQKTIPNVPSGSTQTANVTWTATPAGLHVITVIVDSNQTVSEANEFNNMASTGIYVQSDGPFPDLSINSEDIVFSNRYPNPGETVNISATVNNLGDTIAESVFVVFYIGNIQIGIDTTPILAPDVNCTISTSWVAYPTGNHTVNVKVDPGYSIIESRKDNNVASKEIYVYPPQPDLTPIHLALSDNTPTLGQTITISVNVQNLGGNSTDNVLVSLYDNNQPAGNRVIPWIAGRGGTEEVTFEIGFGSAGWHNLTVVVDPEDAIGEAVETNNHLSTMVFVHPPSADLAISSGDIIFSDRYPTEGDLITIYAQVHNIGELDAYDVVVEFVGIGQKTIPNVPSGSTQTANVTWTATPAGLHVITVIVDSNQTVSEANEFNNMAFRILIVNPPLPPDLLIYSSDIVFSNVNPDPGEIVTIQATVHNVGNGEAKDVDVYFYLDRGIPIETETITSIPPGGSQDVAVEWNASQPGSHVITVVVDLPIDSNKNNNMATRAIIVTPIPERRFSPILNGFQFSNNNFTTKIKMSIDEIRDYFESSQLATAIPPPYWTIFIYVIQAVAWAQQGYCGGMVLTAEQYFENPWLLPSGYSQAHDIPLTDTTTTALISSNQWITQLVAPGYLLKWLLLRLGDDPSGLVPLNDEIEWILQQLDQKNVVELTVFDPSFDWWASHAVLAYDYNITGNNIYLKIYGPNLGNVVNGSWGNWYHTDSEGGQTIHLVKDSEGNYEIADGVAYIEGLEITRLGSREAPIWGWTWVNLLNYIPEILQHVTEYLIREGTTLLTIRAESPVELLVTAPNGFRVGYDSVAQAVVNEVEGAMYSGKGTEPQAITIPFPLPGAYKIEILGSGTGTYTITIELVTPNVTDTETWNGTTSPGELDTSTVQLLEDGSLIQIYDVAVTNVTLSKTIVFQGHSTNVTVNVENQGNFTETFTVTTYANTTLINQTQITIPRQSSTNFTFTWNTTGVPCGLYTISANATEVLGEVDTGDNSYIAHARAILVSILPSDINENGIVDIEDVVLWALAFGSEAEDNPETPWNEHANWNPNVDLNGDRRVDILDGVKIGVDFGKTWTYI